MAKKPEEYIEVVGARVNNLKNIDVKIPHNKLTVITGLSGSGKSSLAFDTIYAEGQRRYIDTFSSYARNMIGSFSRPDVDDISGLTPVISIEQKTTNRNPRSTIGTTTEVYDYLRLLFSKVATARSYVNGKEMIKYSEEKIVELILSQFEEKKICLLAPIVKNRKGHYRELFDQLLRKGYLNVRVDGILQEIRYGMKLDRYKNHSIELVVDRLKVAQKDRQRLEASVGNALRQGDKQLSLLDVETDTIHHFSQMLIDPESGLSYRDPSPHSFSFNSPQGACPCCKGLGEVNLIDRDKIIPNPKLSIAAGGIVPLGKRKESLIFWQIDAICRKYGCSTSDSISSLPEDCINDILNGTTDHLVIENATKSLTNYFTSYNGIIKYIEMHQDEEAGVKEQRWSQQFYSRAVCPECNGQRLNKEALHFFICNNNISQLASLDIQQLYEWSLTIEKSLSPTQNIVASQILKEIRSRLDFMIRVGLDYLSLNRPSATLSGGESQRIRLATQLGSRLVNVTYILDEPSIGLHQRDNNLLIDTLQELKKQQNTIIVVEHDKDIMLRSDYIVDVGPRGGLYGGNVLFEGTPDKLLSSGTLTAKYLNDELQIGDVNRQIRQGNGKSIILKGCRGNNLKNVDVTIPLGKLICVTGPSGSGKSTLINQTLQPILSQKFYRSLQEPLKYDTIEGFENIDKVITVDQSPIGKSPRSNPATYTDVFSDIRALFVSLPEAKIRGYKPGRFSFNVSGGRCEACGGNGYRTIHMNFLPDVLVTCEVCGGKRYNRETMEVRFKGKSIADILDMSISDAVKFFANVPRILKKIKTLDDIGLGYLKLGQPSSTLSGGENQRIKLAAQLAKKDTGKTLFILDEPTTGLHFHDINTLLQILNILVDKGNTVIVIEHNIDFIRNADHIIDMGPRGGLNGGLILAEGTPRQVAMSSSPTSQFL